MAQMDEFRAEREAMKTAPFKKKLEYFWDYYKWPVIIAIVVLVFVGNYIHTIVTATDETLNGILLNTYSTDDVTTDIINEFAEEQNIDLSEYGITLNTTLAYSVDGSTAYSTSTGDTKQVILANAGAGMLDFITADLTSMTDLAYASMFLDLREVLTAEQLEKYEPYFLYVDQAILDEIEEANENYEDTSEIIIPDCSKPEEMENPIPVLIDMSQSKKLSSMYTYEVEGLSFGVAASLANSETTLAFIDYLMN